MLNFTPFKQETPVLEIGGRAVPLRLVRNARAKRLILKVEHSTGEVVVVGPSERSLKKALDFAARERAWIEKSLANVPPRIPFGSGTVFPLRGRSTQIVHTPQARRGVIHDHVLDALFVSGQQDFMGRRVQDWLKREARIDLAREVVRYVQMIDRPLPKMAVRDTTTRWGSCSASGTLSFSWRLVLAKPDILSYVAAHEVAHLVHMNHSKKYWSLVERLYGPYDRAEAWLSAEGTLLHRYGSLKGAR